MAGTAYLVSTALMGLLGAGVVVLVLRGRRWNQYAPQVAYGDLKAGAARPASGAASMLRSTGTWTALYVLFVLGAIAGVVLYSSDALSGTAVFGGLAGIVALYFVVGTYAVMRDNGRPSAQATAGGAIVLGLLAVLAIVANLVMA